MISVGVQEEVDTSWGGYRLTIVTYTLSRGLYGRLEWVRCVPPKEPPKLPRGLSREELKHSTRFLEKVWSYAKCIDGKLRISDEALFSVPHDVSDLELLACTDYTLWKE